MIDLSNTQLGQYQLTEVIRRGGMSTVYKAYQPSLERYVAVKVLMHERDPQFAARFKREARAIAQLQHHNILPIYDYGEQENVLFLVLQYIENGQTLGDMLGAPMAVPTALRLMSHVLGALQYAHERGIIHRDIKPANVLMPSPTWPMLADFGIAKLMNDNQQRLTVPGLIVGTAAYMAPEQATGQPIDARTDLYAAGVMLYEMVTGRVPFDADTPMAVLTKHVYEAPPPPRSLNPDLPAAVEAALLKALAKDPAARYQTAAAMAADLGRLANQIELGRARGQITGFYQAGVRAFEAG
ncbi:MAG TPA: protein kinase, partial [Roseiflexaceae bacterium]